MQPVNCDSGYKCGVYCIAGISSGAALLVAAVIGSFAAVCIVKRGKILKTQMTQMASHFSRSVSSRSGTHSSYSESGSLSESEYSQSQLSQGSSL